jgi:hypothetical protein
LTYCVSFWIFTLNGTTVSATVLKTSTHDAIFSCDVTSAAGPARGVVLRVSDVIADVGERGGFAGEVGRTAAAWRTPAIVVFMLVVVMVMVTSSETTETQPVKWFSLNK